jgi:hypothetical protein
MSRKRELIKRAIEVVERYDRGLYSPGSSAEVTHLIIRKGKPITADVTIYLGEGLTPKTYRGCEYEALVP